MKMKVLNFVANLLKSLEQKYFEQIWRCTFLLTKQWIENSTDVSAGSWTQFYNTSSYSFDGRPGMEVSTSCKRLPIAQLWSVFFIIMPW
jgi:hypothetical protein